MEDKPPKGKWSNGSIVGLFFILLAILAISGTIVVMGLLIMDNWNLWW